MCKVVHVDFENGKVDKYPETTKALRELNEAATAELNKLGGILDELYGEDWIDYD